MPALVKTAAMPEELRTFVQGGPSWRPWVHPSASSSIADFPEIILPAVLHQGKAPGPYAVSPAEKALSLARARVSGCLVFREVCRLPGEESEALG